jgi:hypothetical protein|tara:strand:- start:147 stop:362 length:216 start_codon:yes stop_codon:yes gene_type:complete
MNSTRAKVVAAAAGVGGVGDGATTELAIRTVFVLLVVSLAERVEAVLVVAAGIQRGVLGMVLGRGTTRNEE